LNRVIDQITQLKLYNLPLITFRGRGLWKFNNSLLNDIEFLDTIKNRILDVKKQYAVPVYNNDRISDIHDNEITFTIPPGISFHIKIIFSEKNLPCFYFLLIVKLFF
jgi:hypothetical protein